MPETLNEQQPTPVAAPLANDPAARTPDGTLKDAATSTTVPPTPSEAAPPKTVEPPSVPETYAFTAPEGVELNQDLISKATPLFKDLKLDQASAQKLVDFMAGPIGDHAKKAVEDMRAGWRSEISQNPEMGGKLDAVKADIGRFKDSILGPTGSKARTDFDAAMNLTGAGDHPAIVSAMWKAAKALGEGTHVSGIAPSELGQTPTGTKARPSQAQALYPNSPSFQQ